jgi:hypothetical protein
MTLDKDQPNQIQDLSLNFSSDSLFALTDKIKASVEGRISWGDTFGMGLGAKNDKYLLIWTPKKSSEGQILPGFDSEDGELTLKMRPRPGAWISWIDEAKIATEAKDDHDRVRRSVQELERNTRQVTDFADGVLKDITTVHLGKSLTLSEMVQEVLKVEFTIPTTVKTGGYVLASSQETVSGLAKVIIPEQTNIHGVHLNEDELIDSVVKSDYDRLLVIHRTHIKHYPDLFDVNYCLRLSEYFQGKPTQEEEGQSKLPQPVQGLEPIGIFPTAAVYNPLSQDSIEFVVTALNGDYDAIREAVTESSAIIDEYVSQANQRAHEIMTNFQGRIDSRLQALTLQPGQRIYERVWDDLAIDELRNQLFEFSEFFGKYIGEHLDEDKVESRKESLRNSVDSIIETWQLQDSRQTTIRHLILAGYKLANQVLDQATGLFYDLIFEKHFIETGLLRTVELMVLEEGELLDEIRLPEWTDKTVRDRIYRLALNPAIHPEQTERLRDLWVKLLEIANFADRHQQQFESILKPLSDILLMPKRSAPSGGNAGTRNISLRRGNTFEGFGISEKIFDNVLSRLHDNFPVIKRWIQNTPEERSGHESYYRTLWAILTEGLVREHLCEDFQPIFDINLSLPLETKRLMDLVLGGKIVIRNEKDLNSLKRNLDRALQAKIGRGLQEISTPTMLQIHSDTTLCTLREELLTYQQTLDKQLVRAANPKASKKQGKGKKGRKKGQSPESAAKVIAAIEEEKPKIAELIEFLNSYTNAPLTLLETAIQPHSQKINKIREHQVLNFDLQSLPPIEDTWLEDVKSPDEYPNLRAFLFENKLPISTTGRALTKLRRIFLDPTDAEDASVNVFNIAVDLLLELRVLQDAGYEGDSLERYADYISEKLWRWELTQITETELPILIKEKVLSSIICYEKEVEALLEYVERYERLLEAKLASESEMDKQRELLEENFQTLAETLL